MSLNNIKKSVFLGMALLSSLSLSAADKFVSFHQGDLLLNADNQIDIYLDHNDCRGVSYAVQALIKDIQNVSGSSASILADSSISGKESTSISGKGHAPKANILVGTLGHSAAIDVQRVVRALKVSSEPPKAGQPFPADLAQKLAHAGGQILVAMPDEGELTLQVQLRRG